MVEITEGIKSRALPILGETATLTQQPGADRFCDTPLPCDSSYGSSTQT